MILGGYLPTDIRPSGRQAGNAVFELTVDTTQFVRQISRVVAVMIRLEFELETSRLKSHQVEAMMRVRGGMDPEFATPEARDHYVHALLSGGTTHSEHTVAGVVAFLTGWAAHRLTDEKPEPLAWHRLIGDRALEVSAA